MNVPDWFPPIELWLYIVAVGTACGTLAALYLKVVRPLWRFLRKTSTEALLGDVIDRLDDLVATVEGLHVEVRDVRATADAAVALAEAAVAAQRSHNEWHGAPRGRPASGVRRRPNGAQ